MLQNRFSTIALCLLAAACAEQPSGSGNPSADITTSDGSGRTPADAQENPADKTRSESATFALAGTGWLTIGGDGAVQTTYFDPEGRYRDFRNGELLGEGDWERGPEGRVCFEPDAGRGACWTTSEIDEDGEASATDGEGRTIAIKRVTYLPQEPEASGDGETGRGR